MREKERKKSFSVIDFDLIFQITPSPSQKADQMSHHGDMRDERRTAETTSVVPGQTLNAN